MDDGCNTWDSGYPGGGNYWSNYSGNDSFFGANQDLPGHDGVGDTPYEISDGTNKDNYPLIWPWNGTPIAPVPEPVPPLALYYSPNGTEIPIDTVIWIVWNETMNWTSVEAAFNYTDGINNYSSLNGTWIHDSVTNISTFTPDDVFAYKTQYNVSVNCTASDIVGNLLDQDGNGTGGCWPDDVLMWNFTTVDEAPYVVSTNPTNPQVDVDPNSPIKIVFSEPMNRTSAEDSFSYTNGTTSWNIEDGVVYWSVDRKEMTFSPVFPLERNNSYEVTINMTARDSGGKALEEDYSWWFRTWSEPPAPHVTDTYPPGGAFNVNVNTYINVAFDSEMDIQSVEGAFSYTDGAEVWTIDDGTVDWFSENTMLSFQPGERLSYDSDYTIRIGTNASSIYGKLLDGNDNGIPDVNDDFVFMFSTALEPPIVESYYPAADESGVPTSLPAIYINFSRIMDITSVTNAVSIYPVTSFTPSFSGGGKNLTLVLNEELVLGTQYRVTVMGTAMDLIGTKLDGNDDGSYGDRFTFSFSTLGIPAVVLPEILFVFPADNSTIPIDGIYISISFNVPMNKTSVEQAFAFSNASGEVEGTFVWGMSGKSLRFVPSGALQYNMTYTATLLGTARDLEGHQIGNTTTWHYITETEEVPMSLGNILLYGVIIILSVLIVMLYMANRSLRMELRRSRVKLKRALKKSGLTEDDLKSQKKTGDGEPGPIIEEEMAEGPPAAEAAVEPAVPEEQ